MIDCCHYSQTPDGIIKLLHWYTIVKKENQKGFNLKVAYKLTEDHIKPQYFQKMNVALAFQVHNFFKRII